MEKRNIEINERQREIITEAILTENATLARMHQECKERGIDTAPIEARQGEVKDILNLFTIWWEE
jgi:hypothetical protein